MNWLCFESRVIKVKVTARSKGQTFKWVISAGGCIHVDAFALKYCIVQAVSIACYAQPCTSCLSLACLSVCPSHAGTVKTTQARITKSSSSPTWQYKVYPKIPKCLPWTRALNRSAIGKFVVFWPISHRICFFFVFDGHSTIATSNYVATPDPQTSVHIPSCAIRFSPYLSGIVQF